MPDLRSPNSRNGDRSGTDARTRTRLTAHAERCRSSLIVIAAVSIAIAAVDRLLSPRPLEQIGLGLAVSVGASFVNLFVARVLLRAGRRFQSVTLEAGGRHLITDVWTSAGVVAALGAVTVTGWQRFDPVIGLVVAANIVITGFRIVREIHRRLDGHRAPSRGA